MAERFEHYREKTPEDLAEERLIRELGLSRADQERERRIARENRIPLVEHLRKLLFTRRHEALLQVETKARSFENNPERMPADTEHAWEIVPCDQLYQAIDDSNNPLRFRLIKELQEVFHADWNRACTWLQTPNSMLAGMAPALLISYGQFSRVIVACQLHELAQQLQL